MVDRDRRRRARSYASTGSHEDEARTLKERWRQGQLDRRSLELAARLGHGPAAMALGRPLKGPPAYEDLPKRRTGRYRDDLAKSETPDAYVRLRWVTDVLSSYGMRPVSRAGLAAAELALTVWDGDAAQGEALARGVAALRAWVATSRADEEESLRQARREVQAVWQAVAPRRDRQTAVVAAIAGAMGEVWAHPCYAAAQALDLDYDRVLAAVRVLILPWALGYPDPLEA